jgi:muramoyltetrapeptide carboxypeptidase
MNSFPCQIPPPLQPGDCLRVILPSGPLSSAKQANKGIEVWRARGYEVELPSDWDRRWGYLAGRDHERRLALELELKDADCQGMLCARGGYGGARLLEQWQWPPNQAKWLIGFSDVTSLLWGLAQQGISGVHGPVLTTLGQEPDWSIQRLFDWVEGRSLPPLQGQGWGQGQAQGILLPANLTVATHLLHTPIQPPLTDVILALEDVGEAPYRLDRMLTQWRMTGALRGVRGIALGRFSDCQVKSEAASFTAEEVFRDRLGDLGIPIVSDLPFGHDGVNAALPVGVLAVLDGDRGELVIPPARSSGSLL